MIEKIAVIGAGTMGHAIAGHFAMHGHKVMLYDVSQEVCGRAREAIQNELNLFAEEGILAHAEVAASLERITLTCDLKTAAEYADYVLEATPEVMEIKQELFRKLDEICRPDAILASNTSSLPLHEMIRQIRPERQARTMICHWYNPAHIMPIAELSCFGNMAEEVYAEVEALYKRTGKQPVKVLKDVPGLVANRIQNALAREVFSLLQNRVAAPEDIDRALKFGPAFRYATTGQLEVTDFGGLDIWAAVADNLLPDMDNSTKANPLLKEKVREGKLGFKTGEGFYSYPEDEKGEKQRVFNRRLIRQLKASKAYV